MGRLMGEADGNIILKIGLFKGRASLRQKHGKFEMKRKGNLAMVFKSS